MSGHRRKKGHAEEHHVDERWLVSYADMITVLMALFIVLYAMSTVDQKKFDELKNSLATGFGVTKSTKVDENKGVVRKEDVKKDGAGFSNSTIALMQVAKEIQDELKTAGLTGQVKVASGTNAITISLVGSSTYFDGNAAILRPEALHVLKGLSPSLKKHAGQVTVEGHADPHGSAGTYGTDWNLAAARATSVLVYLVDHGSVDPADISSVSFGSAQSKRAESAVTIEHNRRVDIVLHSVSIPSTAAAADTKTGSDTKTSSETKTATKSASTSATKEATTLHQEAASAAH